MRVETNPCLACNGHWSKFWDKAKKPAFQRDDTQQGLDFCTPTEHASQSNILKASFVWTQERNVLPRVDTEHSRPPSPNKGNVWNPSMKEFGVAASFSFCIFGGAGSGGEGIAMSRSHFHCNPQNNDGNTKVVEHAVVVPWPINEGNTKGPKDRVPPQILWLLVPSYLWLLLL